MSDNFDTLLLDDDNASSDKNDKRSVFLLVLCILSFVGVAIGVIWDFYKLFLLKIAQGALDAFSNFDQGGKTATGINDFFVYYKYGYYLFGADFAGNLIILAGAILMLNRKVTGFALYSFGQIFPIVVYYSLIGFNSDPFQWFEHSGEFVSALFMLMYAFNIKNMTK